MKALRKVIRPSGALWITHLIVMILLMAACAAGGLFGCYTAWKTKDMGACAVSLAILLVLEAVIFFWEKRQISNLRWVCAKKQERYAALTSNDLDKLDAEAEGALQYYKTFCLLENYLYIPKAGILLRYRDIAFWKTVRHSTNGMADAAWVEISEKDGMVWKVKVRQWKQYLRDVDFFLDELQKHGFAQRKNPPAGSRMMYL